MVILGTTEQLQKKIEYLEKELDELTNEFMSEEHQKILVELTEENQTLKEKIL